MSLPRSNPFIVCNLGGGAESVKGGGGKTYKFAPPPNLYTFLGLFFFSPPPPLPFPPPPPPPQGRHTQNIVLLVG